MLFRYAPRLAQVFCVIAPLFFVSSMAIGQHLAPQQFAWGGPGQEEIFGLALSPDGSHTFVGNTNAAPSLGKTDAYILKTNPEGQVAWQKNLGGNLDDAFFSVIACQQGGFVAVGSSASTEGKLFAPGQWIAPQRKGKNDAWIACFDANGDLLWQQLLGGSNDDQALAVRETPNGDLLVTGQTYSKDGIFKNGGHGSADLFVLCLSAEGKLLWSMLYGGSGTENASSGLCIAPDGSIWVAATTESNDEQVSWAKGGTDVWLLHLSAKGKVLAEKTLGGYANDYAADLLLGTDGSLTVAGTTLSKEGDVQGNHGKGDAWRSDQTCQLPRPDQAPVAAKRN